MSREEPRVVLGRGVWVAREGRERRRTLRERECAIVGEFGCGLMLGFYLLWPKDCVFRSR